ncbi:MAG: DUF2288 family protein [Lyngbya sp. HA4199-MV5]|jgi:hypothetical protein|nr:DUF2288 family protein [Lyngbya sp. HA4199-MV5]
MSDLRTALAEALAEAEWDWLAPHARRDSLIVVESGLDVVDVALAIANDDTARVQPWIEENLIHKPFPAQLSDWNQNQSMRFNALIVQPYVLIQEVSQ